MVCRVFKKKSIHQRGFDQPDMAAAADEDELRYQLLHGAGMSSSPVDQKHVLLQEQLVAHGAHGGGFVVPAFDASMHLRSSPAPTRRRAAAAAAAMSRCLHEPARRRRLRLAEHDDDEDGSDIRWRDAADERRRRRRRPLRRRRRLVDP